MDDDKSNPAQPGEAGADALARQARHSLRAADRAGLSTLDAPSGAPYGALAMLALDHDATPLLLLSDLSRHARNLAEDARVALLIDGTLHETPPLEDPLAGPRVTLMGRLLRDDAPAARARYLARHPGAFYAGFGDFHIYRLALERVHFIAGFGQVRWFDADRFLLPAFPGFAGLERRLLDHLGAEDGGLADRLAALAGRQETGWIMTGIDPEGIDLRRGGSVLRHGFDRPARDEDALRAALAGLPCP